MTTEHTMNLTPITGKTLQAIAKVLKRPVSKAEIYPLPFYTHGDFLGVDGIPYIAAGDGPFSAGKLFRLTGNGGDILDANKVAGLTITDDTVLDYLCFFNMFVKANDSVFHVQLGGKIDGRIICGPLIDNKSDHYQIECIVEHGQFFYDCTYTVRPDGEVEMIASTPLDIEDLPMVH
jgi:hypothetical protein